MATQEIEMTEDEFTQAVAELDSPVARMLEEKDAEIKRLKDAIGQLIGNAIDVGVFNEIRRMTEKIK